MVSISRTLLVALPLALGVIAAPTDTDILALEVRQQQGNDSCIPAADLGTQAECYQKCTDAIANFLTCAGVQSCVCNVLETSLTVVDECITCGAIFPLVSDFVENTIIKNVLACDNYSAPSQTPCETPSPTPAPPVCDAAAAFAASDPAQVTMCVGDPATYTHNIGSLGVCITDCLYAIFRAKECSGLHSCICEALNTAVSSVSQCFKCGTLYDEIQGLVEALLIPTLLGCDLDPRPSTTYVICWSDQTTAVLPSGCTSMIPSGTSFATATATTASANSSAPASSASSASATASATSASSVESSASSSAPESSSAGSSSPASSGSSGTSSGLVPVPSGSCIPSSDIGDQGECYQKCTDAIATFLNCAGVQACICNVAEKSLTIINECVTCGAVFPLVNKFVENTVIRNLLSCDNYKPPAQTPCETAIPTPSPPVCDPAAIAFAADDPDIVTMCVADPATYTHNIGSLGVCITDCLYAIFRAKECNGLHDCVCSVLNDVVSSVSQCFKCGTLYDEIQGLVETLLIPTLLGCDLDPRPSTTYVICWSDMTTAVLPSGCTSLVPSGTSLVTATTSAVSSEDSESSSGFATATFPSVSSGSSGPSITTATGPGPQTFTVTTTDNSGETVTVTTCPVCEITDVIVTPTVAPPKTETFTATDEQGSTVIVTVCSACTQEQPQITVTAGESGSDVVVVPNPTGTSPDTVTLTTTNQAGSTVVVTYCPHCEGGSSGGSGGSGGSNSGSGGSSWPWGNGGSNSGSGGSGGSSGGSSWPWGNGGSSSGSDSGSSSGGSSSDSGSSSGGSGSDSGSGSLPGSGSSGSDSGSGSVPDSGSGGSSGSSPGSGSSGSSPGSGSDSGSGAGPAPSAPGSTVKPGNGIQQANSGVALKPTMAAAAIIALVMMA